nr:integrase, catalytic region, zinc finger, CCHC-type, peptidase aspartic, catalytic [Tanacetum cinerariifolium]
NGNGNLVAARAKGNATVHNGNHIRCYNCRGVGHFARNCTVRPRRRDDAYLQTQLLIAQKEDAGIQLQAKEFDLMAVAADLDEIEEVNANCILMANLQQATTSSTQTDKAPVYDSDGSAEVHNHENCYDDDIFNMFTQKEQYTELLEPIPKSHQVPQNDNNVISEVTSVEQSKETVEQHPANVEETQIERLLRAVVGHDIMYVVQKTSIVDTSNLQTELERTKERYENYIIKKENKYAKLWNNWYKKCEECKFDKISYDKAYNDMQHKIERLQAQLRDLKGKRIDNTKTKRPQPRSNTKNDRVPSASKSSRSKNKEVKVEEHHRNLLLSKNKKHMSSACNNIKLESQNVISKVVYAMYKQCLISVNHEVIQIYLWCVDSSCSKHMTGNLRLLINFVWKFMGTVRFRNDHVAAIMGFDDLQWGNILITRVYFVEGLGHNLFSVGQFYDSDLEVAFRRNTCFVRNLDEVDLLKRNHTTNLYTINLHDMAFASLICLMARASSTKSWLWHQRLSHLNFDTINDLAKNDLVLGLAKFKYHKEHLFPLCEQGKSNRTSHPPKHVPNSRQRVYNRRTKKIMETMNVSFDELLTMAFEKCTTYDDFIGGQPSTAQKTIPDAQAQQAHLQSETLADNVPNAMFDGNTFVNPFANPSKSAAESSSLQNVDPSNMHTFYQPYPHEFQWTKDHPLEKVGEPSRPVLTRNQLRSDGDMCMYALIVSSMEPKNDSGFELTGVSDADYAGCKDTFKTTFGGTQLLCEKLVSWSSKKQDCTVLSTAEAEYVSLSA